MFARNAWMSRRDVGFRMNQLKFAAPCLFGVEGILADELRRMDAEEVVAENGRVLFSGDFPMLARANLCSRFAERILILMGEFPAATFTELFDGVRNLPWEELIGSKDAFPVKGWSLSSQLHSLPDCQAIVKKAIVERMKEHYPVQWFDETGPVLQVQFSILKDRVSVMIDTSGEGLHKRGYRKNSNEAPLKETLAAAMAATARIFPDTQLYDPFCGSGTILIESAMMAMNLAPGLRRAFAAERFSSVPQSVWGQERTRAKGMICKDVSFRAYGSDYDPAAVRLTSENAAKAGVGKLIQVKEADIADFRMAEGRSLVITNPPYGERLLDLRAAEDLYRLMGRVFYPEKGKKYAVISPHDDFERLFGRPADKRRKLYNGMMKCQLYLYFKS